MQTGEGNSKKISGSADVKIEGGKIVHVKIKGVDDGEVKESIKDGVYLMSAKDKPKKKGRNPGDKRTDSETAKKKKSNTSQYWIQLL